MDRDAFLDGFRSALYACGGNNWAIPDLSTGPARDAAALSGDWAKIGMDLQIAMDRETLNERQ